MAETWADLKKAGAKLTAKLKIALYERAQKNKMALAAALGQTPAMRLHYYQAGLAKAKMWVVTPGEDDDMTDVVDPSLVSTGCSDKMLAALFKSSVFGSLSKLIGGGEDESEELMLHIRAADSSLELPEEAELSDECAKTFDNAQQTLAVIPIIAVDAVTVNTDIAALDTVEKLDAESVRTEGATTPMSIIGMAMKNQPYWAQRLKNLIKYLETLQIEAPQIKARHKAVRSFGKDVKQASVTQMLTIADEVAYWDAAFPTLNVCSVLKSDMIAQAEQHVKQLTAADDDAGSDLKVDDRVILVHEYQKLYKKLNKIAPIDNRVIKTTVALRGAVCDMDVGVKNTMLSKAAKDWKSEGDEPTLKLKDALAALSGKVLASDAAAAVSSLWMDIYTSFALPPRESFLVGGNANKFTVLQALANSMPEREKADKLTLAEWVNAAWRTKSLAIDLTKMTETTIDDPDYFDVSTDTMDKSTRDLLQASQRLEVACPGAAKLDASKLSDASTKIDEILTCAQALIQKVGNQIRSVMETELNEKVDELKTVVEADVKRAAFEKKMGETDDINELMTFFVDDWTKVNCDELVEKCGVLEKKMKALTSKTLEFGLFKGVSMYEDQENLIKEVRASCCIHEIMEIITAKGDKGDKPGLRKKMRGVQADLKTYQLKPVDIKSDGILSAYNDVLKMKALTA